MLINALTEYKLKKALKAEMAQINRAPLSSYTYLRNGDSICFDPGSARTLIGREFLKKLDHSITKRNGRIQGVGKEKLRLSEWATFTFYLPGKDRDGHLTLMEFEKLGWVTFGSTIDYLGSCVIFKGVDDFAINFEVLTRSLPCVRKVTTTRKVCILPGQKVYIPVTYKPLPADRSFMLTAYHDAVAHAVIDAKTPRVVMAINNTKSVMTIPKRCHVGTINECADSGYFVADWKSAMKAATASVALASMAASVASPTALEPTESSLFTAPVNTEFELTNLIKAVAEGYATEQELNQPELPCFTTIAT
ncbi:hypothetical protein QBC46DRAFT_411237 [Diplogelasinospora grovesii]|uniref:Uncharacterized protein n=1 Tax=Diplogelasinospora grovesii TaxID=303347 RepID=A0AAN6S2D4_9PEZI|nr:hypothetical protein QBC46DRAFT_411237 [Diplogelasinospora grovesii]